MGTVDKLNKEYIEKQPILIRVENDLGDINRRRKCINVFLVENALDGKVNWSIVVQEVYFRLRNGKER